MAIKKSEKRDIISTVKKTIALTWAIDKRFVIITALSTLVIGFTPLAISYAFKIALDRLVTISTTRGAITVSLLGIIALRYLLEAFRGFQNAFLYQYTQRLTRYKIQNYLNVEMSKKISSLDIDYFEDAKTQNLIRKVSQEAFGRIPTYMNSVFFSLTYAVSLLASFIALIPFGIWIPIVFIIVSYPRIKLQKDNSEFKWTLFDWSTPMGRQLQYWSARMQEEGSVMEIKLSGAGEAVLKRIVELQDKLFETVEKPLKKFISKLWAPILIEAAVIFLLIYSKLPLVASGVLSIGTLTFLVQMFDQGLNSTQDLSDQVASLIDDSMYTEDYFKLMNLSPLLPEKIPGQSFESIFVPDIKFHGVSFNYPNGTKVLKNISFTIKAGEHIAIVGPNGAGKSTLIKLLLRFYDPSKGSISINDFDLKDLRRENWYKFVGTLFQSFSKYSFKIKEYIGLSELENPDPTKVEKAAKLSGASEFIENFPDKYEQQLGREFDGEALSVGQWQKLALARAFYEEAPVLILDEPTSAIDAEAEAEIFENLNKTYKDKTLIFVSHRFSTVRNADKIIVLKDGAIAEEGTHESLMKQEGIYARMFRKQAKGYID